MPCIYDDSASRAQGERMLREERNKLAGWLCDLCQVVTEAGCDLPEDIEQWYDDHEKVEAEKIRINALLKLTARERRLLGLDKKDGDK